MNSATAAYEKKTPPNLFFSKLLFFIAPVAIIKSAFVCRVSLLIDFLLYMQKPVFWSNFNGTNTKQRRKYKIFKCISRPHTRCCCHSPLFFVFFFVVPSQPPVYYINAVAIAIAEKRRKFIAKLLLDELSHISMEYGAILHTKKSNVHFRK